MTVHVSNVSLTSEGIELTFMELPGDLRGDGTLIQTRSIAVTNDSTMYADEVQAIRDAVEALVEELIEDWPTTPVYEPENSDDEPEGMGMG